MDTEQLSVPAAADKATAAGCLAANGVSGGSFRRKRAGCRTRAGGHPVLLEESDLPVADALV